MGFRPNRYNINIAISSFFFFGLIFVQLMYQQFSIIYLLRRDTPTPVVLFLILAWAWFTSLRKLQKGRIYASDGRPWIISLLRIRRPGRRNNFSARAAARLESMINFAHRLEHNEIRSWAELKPLTSEDLEYVREVVEGSLQIEHHPDGSQTVIETSAWLLVLSYSTLVALLLFAVNYSAMELAHDDDANALDPSLFTKTITEWVCNWVLLVYALLELLPNGEINSAFQGIRKASFASMTLAQREGLVALYIASTSKPIEGLRQDSCYAPIRMHGCEWHAPRVSTAVLASLGKRFYLKEDEGAWRIIWDPKTQVDTFMVKTVGSSS